MRKIFTPGMRIKLEWMKDPYALPDGSLGTVDYVDDAGQIQMKWDNGSSLALMITISLAAFFGSWICNKIKPSILLFSGGIIFLVFAAEVLLNILYDILSDK